MMQLLNNIFTYSNFINLVYSLLSLVESYLFVTMLLLIFDVKNTHKQKILCVFLILIISKITPNLLSSPFNIILNYACTTLLITFIFKLSILQSLTSLMLTVFIFGLMNVLIQEPYISLCDISFEKFSNTPKYKIPYLLIVYFCLSAFIIFWHKFKNTKLKLTLLNSLSKRNAFLLTINLGVGALILLIQLILANYYIDILPTIICILNFILLAAFLTISTHSSFHIIMLSVTQKNLEYVEEYNKSLQILYDKVSGFKHDFENIMSYINGYINTNDMDGLKEYFKDVKKDYKIAENLSVINPHIINDPGLYSLLNNKFFKAKHSGISFDIEFLLNPNDLAINMYIFSRILGVLIDNAIEASEKCDTKIIKLSFIRDNTNSRSVINIINTYNNKDLDISKIFKKGFSSKEQHSGIGLWQVNKYIKKSKNLELKPSKDNQYFKQELIIYDL